MMDRMTLWLLFVFLALHATDTLCKPLNVLFLASDDMRPEIGAYLGSDFPTPVHPKIHTPNLDRLANKSLLLKRAYVQQAVCNPSRASLLTGRRPDTTHVHDMHNYFRVAAGNFTTIPQYFKEHGYTTAGIGKIFHPGQASNHDDPPSWTEPYYHGNSYNWSKEYSVTWTAADEEKLKKYPLEDQKATAHAIESLKKFAPAALSGEKPFFLALGFIRPHLPFISPAHFFDYYPMEDISLPSNPYAPVGMPSIAWSNFDEMWDYRDVELKYGYNNINFTYPDWFVKNLRRAYYSAITYVDSLVGEVLHALDDLGLSDSTVITFWGDHGWQLGEHAEWCKHTNFEIATHAPMMVHVPGLTNDGVVTENLVEFVDLFPTVAEAAGLQTVPLCPPDSAKSMTCTEGVSLLPLAKDPKREWKSASFSQWPRMDGSGNTIMGYTMRTDRYRYTEWVYYNNTAFQPRWDLVYKGSIELYDHVTDPEENVNVAKKKSYSEVKKKLSQKLHAGWRAALPPNTVS